MKNKRPSAHPAGRESRPDRKQGKPHLPSKRGASPASGESDAEASGGERIAKRLARVGVASRRDAEVMIAEGRVRVNGKVLSSPALNVTARDRIEVDDEPLAEVERTRLFLYHKPGGVVTTSRDPEGRTTIFETLPKGLPRLISVGRLDINTEGLMLLTNDGGLARVLELPTTGWLRRYRVRVHGHVEQSQLTELEKGIAVDGIFYGSIEATLDRVQGTNSWLTISFREGKNREVKNVLSALGLLVTRLIRISFGPFQLGDLPEGAVQEVKGRTLRDQLGERLIEDAGANFDAPVALPFANGPVRAGQERETQVTEKKKERSADGRGPVNRKKAQEEHREDMRGRLQTKPPQRSRDEGKSDRPARAARSEGGDRPFRERRPDGDRPSGDRFGGERRFGDRRPSEGGRFDKPRGEGGDRPFRERRPDGDRPSGDRFGGEKRFGDRRPSEGGRFDKPRGEGGDRPFRERRPDGDRPSGDRFGGEKRFGDRRPSEGGRFDKPRGEGGDRPFRERRPDGDRPGGDRFGGEKRFGDKRPSGDRFGGEKRFGDKRPSEGGRFDKPKSGGRDRDSRSEEMPRSRTAHVWMAPGARPVTRKPEEQEDDRSSRRTERSRSGPPRRNDEGRGPSRANDRSRNDRSGNDRPRNDRSGNDRPRSEGPRNGPSKPRPSGKR